MNQPLTAKQWSGKTGIIVPHVGQLFQVGQKLGLLKCLNPKAQRSRLYFLTFNGLKQQKKLRASLLLPKLKHDTPDINWKLYGRCIYSQRSVVIKTIDEPMQPSQIRRYAVINNPKLKMSSNNVRDIIYWLEKQNIVTAVKVKRKAYKHYVLTEIGKNIKRLLQQAEVTFFQIK